MLQVRAVLRWTQRTIAVGACVLALYVGAQVGETRYTLITARAPRAMMSLELARNTTEAEDIAKEWEEQPVDDNECKAIASDRPIDVARQNLRLDDRFILAYTAALGLAALAALGAVSAPWWGTAAIVVAAVVAGLCDYVENRLSERVLGLAHAPPYLNWVGEHAVPWLRIFAQTKFALVLVVILVTLTATLAAIRRWWLRLPDDPSERLSFTALAETEALCLARQSGRKGDAETRSVTPGSCDEPWVRSRSYDFVGLALSGGGIRSATFNLGLLTGLHRLKALERIDYMATVSGGGYIGSFWTAWLKNQPGVAGATRALWPAGNGNEAGAVRHLREFSRFLATRRGFFEAEMWEAVVAVIAGIVPAFVAAASVIGLGLVLWLAANFFLACPEPWGGVVTVVALSIAIMVAFERGWAARSPLDPADVSASRVVNAVITIFALVVAVLVEWQYVHAFPRQTWSSLKGTQLVARSYEGWWQLTGIHWTTQNSVKEWFWSPRLYDLALVWLVPGMVLLALRPPFAALARRGRHERIWGPAFDRVVMRLIGSALGWAAIATVWLLSINFLSLAKGMAVASLASAGAFAALRNWIGMALRSGTQASPLGRLKPYLPEILAYVTVTLLIGGVGSVLVKWGGEDWFNWYTATGAMGLAIAGMLLLDPAEIGLHAFYRDRIVRAYSGASNPMSKGVAARNRQTDRREGDDLLLGELPARPLHLVCCAANDLSGDPIETLGRGARSAVLSRHGIAMANGWAPPPQWLTLGGAVTASAAAFNSNMGSVSMSVGPVVAFLMAALNLRLGLWVPNPTQPRRRAIRLLPGALFFSEMFALTVDWQPEIHLSDGAHFENLALYELVRRHCRYIIVSDCGEDPSVAFDDFGNAARRIREDFGVHIDIDLSALRPNAERRSQQHVVVGTINYTDFDKGILLYVKPTLTGDEPPDVLQHATRNRRFPHEPTSDQFYDEAQWESYRQLGEHTAGTVFAFVDRYPGSEAPTADWIFTTARQDWYPTPPDLPERVLEMTERFASVESDLREWAIAMLDEVFPEAGLLRTPETATKTTTANRDELAEDHVHTANLTCIVRVTQLMEDVWASCQLDAFWNHPLNLGWVNRFARWTSAPTFRMWWPLLCPMYNAEFQRFMREHFSALDYDPRSGTVLGPDRTIPRGLAAQWWEDRHAPAPELNDNQGKPKSVYVYSMDLSRPGSSGPTPMQVGLVLVREVTGTAPSLAWWSSDDFFVPPSLWGAGMGSAFLWKFLQDLRASQRVQRLQVYVKAPKDRNDPGSWADRVSYVEFYKKQGFRFIRETTALPDGAPCRAVHLELEL